MSTSIPEPIKHGIEYGTRGGPRFTGPCCVGERENRRRARRGLRAGLGDGCFCTEDEARANPHNLEEPARPRWWHVHLFRTIVPTRSALYQACRCGKRRALNLTGHGGISPVDPNWVPHGRLANTEDWIPPNPGTPGASHNPERTP